MRAGPSHDEGFGSGEYVPSSQPDEQPFLPAPRVIAPIPPPDEDDDELFKHVDPLDDIDESDFLALLQGHDIAADEAGPSRPVPPPPSRLRSPSPAPPRSPSPAPTASTSAAAAPVPPPSRTGSTAPDHWGKWWKTQKKTGLAEGDERLKAAVRYGKKKFTFPDWHVKMVDPSAAGRVARKDFNDDLSKPVPQRHQFKWAAVSHEDLGDESKRRAINPFTHHVRCDVCGGSTASAKSRFRG